MPIEPPPSIWAFPDPTVAGPDEVVALGADLAPGTLLAAYRSGLFPMPGDRRGELLWWSPDPRGVFEPGAFRVSGSLRRSARRLHVAVDTRFRDVMTACATQRRPGNWINDAFIDAYTGLHDLGWAHSVEVADDDGRLVGGVYGIAIGGFFAGESMFHTVTDASKVALWALTDLLDRGGCELFDIQWLTPHLASLGATELSRSTYVSRLAAAVSLDVEPFAGAEGDTGPLRAGR